MKTTKASILPNSTRTLFSASKISFILLIVIVGIILRVIIHMVPYSCLLQNQWCGQDMDQYKDYSDNLLSGHGFSARVVTNMYFIDPKEHVYVPEVLRLPAYPYLLSFGRLVFNSPLLVLIINLISYGGICSYTYLLTKKILNKWYALLSLLLVFLSGTLLFYATQMGDVDVFVTCAVIGFFYHYYSLAESKYTLLNSILAVIWGYFAIFSRQNTILLIGVYALFYLLWQRRSARIRQYISIIAILGIMILFWMGRNFMLTGKPTISALSGEQLFVEHIMFTPYPDTETARLLKIYSNDANVKYIQKARRQGKSVDHAYMDLSSIVQKQAEIYIVTHPKSTIRLFLIEVRSFFLSPTFQWDKGGAFSKIRVTEQFLNVVYMVILAASFPLCIVLRKRLKKEVLFLWLGVICFIFLSAFAHGIVIGNRGILPVIPLLSLITCYFTTGIVSILIKTVSYAERKNSKKKK